MRQIRDMDACFGIMRTIDRKIENEYEVNINFIEILAYGAQPEIAHQAARLCALAVGQQ